MSSQELSEKKMFSATLREIKDSIQTKRACPGVSIRFRRNPFDPWRVFCDSTKFIAGKAVPYRPPI